MVNVDEIISRFEREQHELESEEKEEEVILRPCGACKRGLAMDEQGYIAYCRGQYRLVCGTCFDIIRY